jgi:hypothetical protein
MADVVQFPDVPGAAELFAWFGYWPSFHNGEVLSLHLDRTGPSRLRVHTWEGTHQLDSRGYIVLQKHVVVTFILQDVSDSELDEFNHQNVLSDLTLTKDPNGYKLEFGPCFGLNGTITAASVRIELEPGMPPNS